MKFSAIGIAFGAVLSGFGAEEGRGRLPHCGARAAMMPRAMVSYVSNLWPKCDARHSGRRNAMH
jgi:hypothetical protein